MKRPKEELLALRAVAVAALSIGLAIDREVEPGEPEDAAKWLGRSLSLFCDLANLAEEHGDSISSARAWRDVMKVHLTLRNEPEALTASEKCLERLRGRGSRREIGHAVGDCAVLRALNGAAGEIEWSKASTLSVFFPLCRDLKSRLQSMG